MSYEEDDYQPFDIDDYMWLEGKQHVFPDGDSLTIVHVRMRDDGPWVMYNIQQGPGIPRRQYSPIAHFMEQLGYLFEEDFSDDDDVPHSDIMNPINANDDQP